MNISNGLDKICKVLFGVLVAGALVSAALLLMVNMPNNVSKLFAFIVAVGFIIGCLIMYDGGELKHTLVACLLMAYSIYIGAYAVNKGPDGYSYTIAIGGLAGAWLFFFAYLGAKKIGRYIFQGFTGKT